jgi:hypothetical protein
MEQTTNQLAQSSAVPASQVGHAAALAGHSFSAVRMKKPRLPQVKVVLVPAGEMPADQFDFIFRIMRERVERDWMAHL